VTTQTDVRRLALGLPDVRESTDRFEFRVMNNATWKGFAWAWNERVALNKPRVQNPDVLAVRVANLTAKEASLGSDTKKFFTEAHYDGFPAILVRLSAVDEGELRELLLDAWSCMASRESVRALFERLGH
jgi:hypothetical protein